MKRRITIEPKFTYAEPPLSWFGLTKEIIVQGDLFKLGFTITNIDKNRIKNLEIKNVKVTSAQD